MTGLPELARCLATIDLEQAQAIALRKAAARVEAAVRAALRERMGRKHDPGVAGGHEPEASVANVLDGMRAVIGSNSALLRDEELGTRSHPPRPTFRPVAAELGQEVGAAIGAEIAGAIKAALAGNSGLESV